MKQASHNNQIPVKSNVRTMLLVCTRLSVTKYNQFSISRSSAITWCSSVHQSRSCWASLEIHHQNSRSFEECGTCTVSSRRRFHKESKSQILRLPCVMESWLLGMWWKASMASRPDCCPMMDVMSLTWKKLFCQAVLWEELENNWKFIMGIWI